LLRGSLLDEALRFENLNRVEEAFVQKSLSRRRLSSQLAIAGAVLVLVAAVFAVIYYKTREATAHEQAAQALSRELAAKASTNKDRLDLALLLAMQAYKTRDTSEARSSLATLLTQSGTAKLVTFLPRSKQAVRTLSWADASTLRGVANNGQIYTWNTKAPQEQPKAVATKTSRVTATAQGKEFCALSTPDGEIIVADLTTGGTKQSFKIKETADELALSSDGKVVAAAESNSEAAHVWDVDTGKVLADIAPTNAEEGFADDISELTLNNNGTRLAYVIGFGSSEIRLYDVAQKRVINKFSGGKSTSDTYYSIALNSDGTLLAASSQNGLMVWDTRTGKRLAADSEQKNSRERPLLFIGSKLVLVTDDGNIEVYAPENWHKITEDEPLFSSTTIEGLPEDLLTTVLGGENEKLLAASTSRGNVLLWNFDLNNELRKQLVQTHQPIGSMTLTRDGKTLAYASREAARPTITLLDLKTQKPKQQIPVSDIPSTERQAPSTERFGGRASIAGLYSTQDDSLVAKLFDPFRRYSAFWNSQTGEVLTIDRQYLVRQSSVSPDGKAIAVLLEERAKADEASVGNSETKLALWRFGSELQLLTDKIEALSTIAFSSDGKTLASIDKNNLVTFWDSQTGVKFSEFSLGQSEDSSSESIRPSMAFSPDGKILAVASSATRLTFYDLLARRSSEHFVREYTPPIYLVFSRDGRKMALSSRDGIEVWDVESEQVTGSIPGNFAARVAFSLDGESLIVASAGAIYSWDINVNSWLKRGCAIANRNLTQLEWDRFVGKEIPYQSTCGR